MGYSIVKTLISYGSTIFKVICAVLSKTKGMLSFSLVIIFLAVRPGDTTNPPLTPKAINHLIKKKGAAEVLNELCPFAFTFNGATTTWYQDILPGIASGTPDWLDVAFKLYSVSDAAIAEDLAHAIGHAVDTQPVAALKLILAHQPISIEICGKMGSASCARYSHTHPPLDIGITCGYVDAETPQRIIDEIDRREKSLTGVREPSLQAAKNLCIKYLEEGRRALYPKAKTTERGSKPKTP